MYPILDFNKFQLELLCYYKNLRNLIPLVKNFEEEEVKPRLVLILRNLRNIELRYNQEFWEEWYELLKTRLDNPITLTQCFYFPGYCFQRKYRDIWNRGFEFRYARRSVINTYLLCIQKLNQLYHINISSDISSYILSFLLTQDIGIEIKVKKFNEGITKKKNYLEITNKINECRVGHRPFGPMSCARCNELTSIYRYADLGLSTGFQDDFPDEDYHGISYFCDDITLPRRKLELDLLKIKHSIKLSRLKYRALVRLEEFQNC